MDPAVRSISLPGRTRLRYAAQGDPSGVPVLPLHGYTDSWLSFEPVLRRLPPAVRACVPSQRGHGDSGRSAGGYRPQGFAEFRQK